MKNEEVKNIMKENTSRSITVVGFGMINIYVPKKQLKKMKEMFAELFPDNVFQVRLLNQNFKKGKHLFGSLKDGTFSAICKEIKS